MVLSGCADNASNGRNPEQPIPADVTDSVTTETQTVDTSTINDKELLDGIKSVESNAVVTESLNSGEKLLSVELPAADADVAKDFVSKVSKIAEKCKLGQNREYDYYYFCASKDDKVLVFATFDEDDNKLELENIKAVDASYEKELETAIAGSALFMID